MSFHSPFAFSTPYRFQHIGIHIQTMLVAIDIGNSNIKCGIFDGPRLISKFSIQTNRHYTAEELMFDRFRMVGKNFIQSKVDTVMVASVVPQLERVVSEACRALFKVTPKFVNSSFDLGIRVLYEPPAAAGADRLVAAAAAAEKYGTPCIICDLGTATTIDAVNARGEYLGGSIAPGMKTMAQSLAKRTSKLPRVDIEKPRTVIGHSTIHSIRSGVFYACVGSVDAIIRRMSAELGRKPTVVATGGFARLIAVECKLIKIVDEDLILYGLRLLAERN